MTGTKYEASDVSVVIPTVGRPTLARAVRSVLEQTIPVREVLVVDDGGGDIELPPHPRVRVLKVGPGLGGNAARSHGIAEASGAVVALLDDDDAWAPDKVAVQLSALAATDVPEGRWLVTSRLVADFPTGRRACWPARLKSPEESLPEYVFRKHRLRGGVGFVQASTLMFPRSLALDVPFDPSLRYHQDISWLVDVARNVPEVVLVQCPEALVTYHVGTGTVSKRIRPEESVRWARDRLGDGDDLRTLGDFLLTHSVICARNHGDFTAMRRVIGLALRVGRPGLPSIGYALLQLGALATQSARTTLMHAAVHRRDAAAT